MGKDSLGRVRVHEEGWGVSMGWEGVYVFFWRKW